MITPPALIRLAHLAEVDPGPMLDLLAAVEQPGKIEHQAPRGHLDRSPPRSAVLAHDTAVPPRQLPGDVADFSGRWGERHELITALTRSRPHAGQAPIAVVHGAEGVGKTALAVHVCHHMESRFPDGQLFVNLHGSTGSRPRDVADILKHVLHTLGVPRTEIPEHLDDKATMYRNLIARRRILVVLDDAADAKQIKPLLPGTTTAATIVTSRHLFDDLGVTIRVQLGLLSHHETEEMLKQVIGGEFARLDKVLIERTIRFCRGVPSAVRSAGVRLSTPESRLAHETAKPLQARLSAVGSG